MKTIQVDAFADTLHAENCTENVEPSCAPVSDSCPDEAVDHHCIRWNGVWAICDSVWASPPRECSAPKQWQRLQWNPCNDSDRQKNWKYAKATIFMLVGLSVSEAFRSPKPLAQKQIIHLKPLPDMVQPKKLPSPFSRKQNRNDQWKVYRTQTVAWMSEHGHEKIADLWYHEFGQCLRRIWFILRTGCPFLRMIRNLFPTVSTKWNLKELAYTLDS